MYVAIIGDIVGSRKIKNRNELQNRLNSILKEINNEYSHVIAADFLITLGDEFQGLLESSEYLFEIVDKIRFSMYPVKLRVGVGIGTIDTEVVRHMAIGADGPAFHYARKMMEELHMNEASQQSRMMNLKLWMNGDEDLINLVNSNLSLCSCLENGWTEKQIEAVSSILYQDITQRELAGKLGISPSSVQRRLNSAHYYDYRSAREIITEIFQKRWGKENE